MTKELKSKIKTLLINNYINEKDITYPFKGKVSVSLPNDFYIYDNIVIYDSPIYLPFWFEELSKHNYKFKYHIVIYFAPENTPKLPSAHTGLLLFSKDGLSIKKIRVPHKNCKFCNQNVKDWGGKKHLMNPEGVAISDVWKHLNLSYSDIINSRIPKVVELELRKLFDETTKTDGIRTIDSFIDSYDEINNIIKEEMTNKVYCADAIEKLNELPKNSIDLIFVDPPYNLNKNYKTYHDERNDYIEWSEQWISKCLDVIKSDGSFVLLNIPKWAHELAFKLIPKYYIQEWIVWDEPGEPRGKMIPAHYSLLWFSKNRSPLINKLPDEQASLDFCSRQKCKKNRSGKVQDEIFVRDVRWDIHRVKAGKRRFNHPTQLPEKLLDFIIRLTTKPGQIVLDPMMGTGTTVVTAKNLNRKYIGIDIDQTYVNISKARLEGKTQDLTQNQKSPQKINGFTKKDIQIQIGELAIKLGHLPSEDEIYSSLNISKQQLLDLFKSWSKVVKYAKLILKKR